MFSASCTPELPPRAPKGETSGEPAAVEAINRHPFGLERAIAKNALEPRDDALRLLLRHGIGGAVELQIDAPHIVGLAVHQRRLAVVERRVEPEAPLSRKIRRHADIRDQ